MYGVLRAYSNGYPYLLIRLIHILEIEYFQNLI